MFRTILMIILVVTLAAAAAAFDLGAHAPAKLASASHPAPPPEPDLIRQGGDTMADAILMPVPGTSSGTTAGFTDDYDEVCPYIDSTAPDVVYKLAPAADIYVDIDMLGSAYDTKIYVYREDMTLVACNDDWYPDYVSKLEAVDLQGDVKYFLVIDGYGEEAGDYVVEIREHEPCELDCPAGAELEGEPPLADGYEDLYNGGCNTDGIEPFGTITSYVFCGVSGWFVSFDGMQTRDTDWFELTIPPSGFLEINGDAEYETYMFELGPQDCASVEVIQSVTIGPCEENTLFIPGQPGDVVWFWVGPTTFEGPVDEYDYVIMMNMWAPPPVATEPHSWSAVKSLFE